jgi:AcrR family transcriptional regulator
MCRPSGLLPMSRPKATSDADLLAAAHRVVMRLGPNLTLADVAREAGVSAATLVQRFGSKRGLLLAFAATGAAGMSAEFARIRQHSRSALAAVYATADCMASMAETPQMLANSVAFLQIDLTDPDFQKHAHAHSRAMQAGLEVLLNEAVSEGDLMCRDTSRLARAVQTMIGGSLLQWAIDRDGKVHDRLREDLDTLLKPRGKAKTAAHAAAPRERRRHRRRKVVWHT